MPTSANRGRYNWACPAALRTGSPLVVVGSCEDTTLGRVFMVVWVGNGLTVGAVGTGTVGVVVGTGTTVGAVGTGGLTVGVVGTGGLLTVGVVGTTGGGGGTVVGGGALIVVGPPTGPEQTSPMSQHPMMPLLARAQ